MQKKLKDLLRIICQNSNLIGINKRYLEGFAENDTSVFFADFQTDNNHHGAFKSLCNRVQEKLTQDKGKNGVDNMLIYIDVPDGEQGLTLRDMETVREMQTAIAPTAKPMFALGTHSADYLRMAVILSTANKKPLPAFFSFKGNNIFAFSDSHGLHERIAIPQQTDILICAGDAVEDNLNPDDYHDFLVWYRKQPAQLRLFIPGNHELSFEIAPLWAETLFKTDEIVLLHDGIFSFKDINFASITEDTASNPDILPKDTDILITHYPPFGILDDGMGSTFIRQAVETMNPYYHIFGHIHSKGIMAEKVGSTKYINVSYNNILKKIS